MPVRSVLLLCSLFWFIAPSTSLAQSPRSEDFEFFEKTVRPILHDNCHSCHGPTKQRGNLRLDSREAILKGGDDGPAAVPGHPEKSLLVKAIGYGDGELRMPPRSKLTAEQVSALTRWVERGLAWPEAKVVEARPAGPVFDLKERSRHWCWQPLQVAPVPLANAGRNPIDAFLNVRLHAAGIRPAQPADRLTLLRRVTFDLIGLPPPPEEIAEFLADDRPDALEHLIDRLLASPHYGERWGRHWLDLVRFAETRGHEFDPNIPEAYRYRDYVIRAFNADVPYDQMVLEHVAGDLLTQPRIDAVDGTNASIQATAFWFLGEAKHSPVDVRADEAERIDNQIDVFSKAFLGLTVACARCHDHKFDAITTADYYALASYLQSSHQQMAFLDASAASAAALGRLQAVQERLEAMSRTVGQRNRAGLSKATLFQGASKFEDFERPDFSHWYVSGTAFGNGPTTRPTPVMHPQNSPQAMLVPAGVAHSGLLADSLAGVLRSQSFSIAHKYAWFHVGGSGGQVRIIIDGFELIQEPIYGGLQFTVDSGETRSWRAVNLSMWQGHRAYIELNDPGPGYLSIDAIAFSDKPPAEPMKETAATLVIDPKSLQELSDAKRSAEGSLPHPERVIAIEDATPWPGHIYVRGNPNNFGATVPARFLEVFGGAGGSSSGCGSRLDLARRMLTQARPLLTRVLVNRLWKEHFGEGLVRTPDNFGKLGEPPDHPELLDYLAAEFIRRGWSIKQMHRMIMLSDAYQRSSEPSPEVASKDPQNRLLSCQPVRRLEAECIRDAILAISGRLDQRLYGPSVAPFLNEHMAGRGRPTSSGPIDGAGRRSIYLNVRRNFLSPFLLAFDYPVPFTTMGRRMSSNVPAQALILLNDPFVINQASLWARHLFQSPDQSPTNRIHTLYLTAFGRPPTPEELETSRSFLQDNEASQGQGWADLCHVLLNVKEFIFVR